MSRITVVIPVFNKANHVERAIDSVIRQSVQDFDLILVEDNSTDDSLMKIQRYQQDPRVKILQRSEPGPGGYAARNLGVETSETELIAFCDADDAWEPLFLERILEAFDQYSDAGIACTGFLIVDGEKKKTRDFDFVLETERMGIVDSPIVKMAQVGFIHTPCVAVRKSAFLKAGAFPAGEYVRGGDVVLWYRMLKSTDLVFINETLQTTYVDADNRVSNIAMGSSTPLSDELEADFRSGAISRQEGYEWYVRSRMTAIRESILQGNRSPDLLRGLWACRKTKMRRMAALKLFAKYCLPRSLSSLKGG